jgi:hypothetical protein
MKTQYIIEINDKNVFSKRSEYIRVYKNGRIFTTRLHCETATHFNTLADAEAAARKFGLNHSNNVKYLYTENNRTYYYVLQSEVAR